MFLINKPYMVFILSAKTLFSLPTFSQQQPYHYQLEVKYKMTSQPDSTDKQSIKDEFMTLLIGKAQSVFCATQYLVMDSAITAELTKGNSLGPSMGFFQANGTHNSLVVFKDTSTIITSEPASRFISPATVYKYTEPKSQFDWRILEDTISVGGILCQKATVNFGGRKWFAWFASSIPISEGPYKFNGLPGLILKVNDAQQYWNFDLASIKNINKSLKINFKNKTPQQIKNKEEFLSKKKYSRDNRFQLMKLNGGYKFSDPVYFMKQYEKDAKKDNNWIELYKGK